MPALDFRILNDARLIIEQRTGLTATLEWDTLLMESAGLNAALERVYRPYGVAALLLGAATHDSVVREAEGVVFADPAGTIRALIQTQAAWDESQALTVPGAFTIAKLKAAALGGGGSPGPIFTPIGYS